MKITSQIRDAAESVLLKRIYAKRIDGYTIATAEEIIRAVAPLILEEAAKVAEKHLLDAIGAHYGTPAAIRALISEPQKA